ncbi:hypothetical protein OQA88_4947 [Cercophora sp. LCS_1]
MRPVGHSSPPTLVRLQPSVGNDANIVDLDLSEMDEDPLTYFLTPAQPPVCEDSDAMDFEFEFDAGIEDAKHPAPIIRSVSPSSLGGLSLPPSSPPRRSLSPDMPPTPEDHEDYIHLAAKGRPHSLGLPFSLRDLATGKGKNEAKDDSSPPRFPLIIPTAPLNWSQEDSKSRPEPRALRASQRRGRSKAVSLRRSPHVWREPSPDVWSIEEETEEEVNSEMGNSAMYGAEDVKTKAIDIQAAKPLKRVRFVLPEKDEFDAH